MLSQTRKKAQNLLSGDGVELDVDKAIQLLVQGGNSGEAACYYDLAETYFDGVPEDDPQKALHYLESAGNTGHGRSCSYLSRIYSGESVLYSPEDLVKPNAEISMEWSAKGLELEDPESMLKMARYYITTGDSKRAEIIVANALAVLERGDLDSYTDREISALKSELETLS